jgi:hypothetical protein
VGEWQKRDEEVYRVKNLLIKQEFSIEPFTFSILQNNTCSDCGARSCIFNEKTCSVIFLVLFIANKDTIF